jgi:hypothetical protein
MVLGVLQQGRENYLIFDVFFYRLAHGRDCDPATLVWMGKTGQPQSWSVQMKEIGGPKMCKMHQHAEKLWKFDALAREFCCCK